MMTQLESLRLNGLEVFDIKVLMGILGPEKEKVAGRFRQLLNGKHHRIYFYSDIVG
jgi:hypothetical protein